MCIARKGSPFIIPFAKGSFFPFCFTKRLVNFALMMKKEPNSLSTDEL